MMQFAFEYKLMVFVNTIPNYFIIPNLLALKFLCIFSIFAAMEKEINIGIIGATAFTGRELVEILIGHPFATIAWMTSRTEAGKDYSEIYPQFAGRLKGHASRLSLLEDGVNMGADVVFSCLPHGASAEFLYPFLQDGTKVIDLSADFRLKDIALYETTYKVTHPIPQFIKTAAYGLVEVHRANIKEAQVIGNPGCYPTSVLLPLLPLVKNNLIQTDSIIADSKSGVSGAGRKASATTHFINCNESINAYKIGDTHRHLSEMKEQLTLSGGRPPTLLFTPHLMPMERGILSTLYVTAPSSGAKGRIAECLADTYAAEHFVQVVPQSPKTSQVAGTNQCHIHIVTPRGGDTIIICSVIDNLIKGAAGQAVQNMNVVMNIPETSGLR